MLAYIIKSFILQVVAFFLGNLCLKNNLFYLVLTLDYDIKFNGRKKCENKQNIWHIKNATNIKFSSSLKHNKKSI